MNMYLLYGPLDSRKIEAEEGVDTIILPENITFTVPYLSGTRKVIFKKIIYHRLFQSVYIFVEEEDQ